MSTVDDELFDTLKRISTATLQGQLYNRGFRNTFLYGLRPLTRKASFAGEAFTLRAIPSREDIDTYESFKNPEHPQRKAFDTIGQGQVLIVDARAQGWAASGGSMLMNRLMVRGAAAFVTDGSIRDSGHVAEMDFPVYTSSVSATTNPAGHHSVDMQIPIACAGVPIYPGDVLVGDVEGIVVIPRDVAADIAEPALAQEKLEAFLLERVRGGAPLRGTYPADEETLAAYEDSLKVRSD
jgi:regulator of RNase E activity RraA